LFLKNTRDGSGFDLEALIFDLDGTLIDSIEVYYAMMKRVFKKLCWPDVPREVMRKAIKDGGFEWGSVLPPGSGRSDDELIAEARDVIREAYPHVFEDKVHMVPGADQLLRELHEHRVKLGLVTSTLARFIEFKLIPLKRCGVHDLFHAVITLDDVENRKPSGDPLLECARRIGEDPGRCAYIGDTTGDMVAGKTAGMRAIGVLTGLDDYEALKAEGPDMIVESVFQLQECLVLSI